MGCPALFNVSTMIFLNPTLCMGGGHGYLCISSKIPHSLGRISERRVSPKQGGYTKHSENRSIGNISSRSSINTSLGRVCVLRCVLCTWDEYAVSKASGTQRAHRVIY